MDLYSTSAGAISQGNIRRRGLEQAQGAQRARLTQLSKNWSDAQKNFDEQKASNVSQVEQAGQLREIKDQIGNAFAVSSMPAKMANYQKWSQGGVDKLGAKLTSPAKAAEQAGREALESSTSDLASHAERAGQNVASGASEALAEGRPSLSRVASEIETVGKDGKAGVGSRLMTGARKAVGMSEKTAERLGKGAGMLGGAVIAGNDIAADLKGGLHIEGNNALEKVSNVSGIIGGIADIGGAFFPPLELLGGVAGLVSGVTGAIGDFEDTLTQEDKQEEKTLDTSQEKADVATEKSLDTGAQRGGTTALGRAQ